MNEVISDKYLCHVLDQGDLCMVEVACLRVYRFIPVT